MAGIVDTKHAVEDTPAPSSGDASSATAHAGGKRKLSRTALTLREKAIVKSFCEQKVADCKARGELVPSQEALRREVAAQFGWSCGRSTLSKIISMDWRLLRSGEQGGDAPRNPNMKRRRRPLFPAFEADLVQFITNHLAGGDSATAAAGSSSTTEDAAGRPQQPGDQSTAGGGDQSRVLTEALILEEAQRLKQVHGVSDEMLVLSVGWLARFKHRHCIRLRKPAGVSTRSLEPQTMVVVEGIGADSGSLSGWSAGLTLPSLTQPEGTKGECAAHPPTPDAATHVADDNGGADMLPSEDQQAANLPANGETMPSTSATPPPPPSKRAALCSAQWCQQAPAKSSSATTALLEQVPANIRELACSCQGSAADDFKGGISGLRVAVVGFGSVVKAFLAAALVGTDGFVTCVDASPSNVYLAEQAAGSYCLETLGLPLVNMKFIVGEYGGMAQSVPLSTDGLKGVQGQADLAICNCSIQSLEFPASKNAMLELAFSLLKIVSVKKLVSQWKPVLGRKVQQVLVEL
ncbi:Arsenite methyltransferase [Phytophthora cinnamomi]|uniref:Arsenite methyltransferase n=1 Tax=Phytophthora cinnamomi TaxID=4785 RepID=UPI00355A6C32|nr:Arsenite methyltransferase [Phytophthora cinnamomi]